MNLLAYFIIHSPNLSAPVLWIVNIIVICILAVILWKVLQLVAKAFQVPADIVQLVGILLFLLLILSLFTGCVTLTPAQKDFVNSRLVTAAASRGVTPADSKVVLDLLEHK